MIGLSGSTGLEELELLRKGREEDVKTEHGLVTVVRGEGYVYVPRHGKEGNVPPHKVNHKANVSVYKELGIKEVLGITSVGSLKKKIKPGMIVVPTDYIQLANIPTFFDDSSVHVTPGLDESVRERIFLAAKKAKVDVVPNSVYFQTLGPRLETKAEVRFISAFADVVGMTMGSEATLARELGIKYAALCSVDNYAHGIVDEELDFSKVLESIKGRKEGIEKIVNSLIEEER